LPGEIQVIFNDFHWLPKVELFLPAISFQATVVAAENN
jgi:hypothetical protein